MEHGLPTRGAKTYLVRRDYANCAAIRNSQFAQFAIREMQSGIYADNGLLKLLYHSTRHWGQCACAIAVFGGLLELLWAP